MKYIPTLVTVVLFGAASLNADFRYESTTRITGGALVGMMKFAGAFSKDARKANAPQQSTTAVKGNRMLYRTADTAQIIDLDRRTITRVNFANRTYSVVTFEQMKQAMEDMSKRQPTEDMSNKKTQGNPNSAVQDIQFDVSLKETGQTRQVAGVDAHEVIMTITAKGKDAESGATGGLDVVNDLWIGSKVAGYDEIRAFYKRMGQTLNWTPAGSPMGAAQPGMERAMAEMYKEGAKLDGMPVLSITKVGGRLDGMPQGETAQPSRPSTPTPSVGEALGGALAGRMGLGGFGRRKPKQEDAPATAPASGGSTGTGSAAVGSLLEMSTEITSYSAAAADPGIFEVPSGFNQVQEDAMPKPGRQPKR